MTATLTRKPRKAPVEVHGSARWILELTTGPLGHAGILQITVEGNRKPTAARYAVTENREAGRLLGYRLTKLTGRNAGQTYDVAVDLSSCDCPDSVHAEERPGGCKHRKALAAALASLS